MYVTIYCIFYLNKISSKEHNKTLDTQGTQLKKMEIVSLSLKLGEQSRAEVSEVTLNTESDTVYLISDIMVNISFYK